MAQKNLLNLNNLHTGGQILKWTFLCERPEDGVEYLSQHISISAWL